MYSIIDTRTININGRNISLPCNIMKNSDGRPYVFEKAGLVIVNYYGQGMETMTDQEMEQNISAFDQEGNEVWKVAPPTIRPYKCNPYTSVFERDGKVFGGNWCGYDFEINLEDGSVTPPKNPGRPW